MTSSRRTSTDASIEGMSVTFNRSGTLLYALRRRLPPVLFKLHQSKAFCQFDADDYVNLCTMKAGCFAGDDDQVSLFGQTFSESIASSSTLFRVRMTSMCIFGEFPIMTLAVSEDDRREAMDLPFHCRDGSTFIFITFEFR
jgi:hypothetical protein